MFVFFKFAFNEYLVLLKFSVGACQICSEVHISAVLSMLLIFQDEKFCRCNVPILGSINSF